MASALGNLTWRQRELLDQWLPGASVERDHGWGLVETTVLELTHAGSRFIVKAGGESDHHIERELHAHLHWLGPWTSRGRAPALERGDADAKLIVTRYLPGRLVRTGSRRPLWSDSGPRSPGGRRRPRHWFPPTGTGSPGTGSSTTTW